MSREFVEEKYAQLEAKVGQYIPDDLERLRAAFEYAYEKHDGQRRKDGSPFVTHPIAVAELVADLGLDMESLMAALMHDCIEDTDSTYEEVSHKFGETVAELVDGVTKLTRVHYTSKAEEQVENLRKMLMAMAKDVRVILIKICDRTHNIRTMEYQSEHKQREKSLETLEIYAPIAHRLGMQRMKWELEDLSIKYLDPVAYKEISEEMEKQAELKREFMENVQNRIQARLGVENITGTVYGRIKHIYSIYRKMYAQNKNMSEIFDLYAFRVIVPDMPSCYNVLGIVHDEYKPVVGRFKDYIGTPKPNMYQSLHTTVIGTEGLPFEVQIRTWEMHQTAEYGVAAHWKYKQGMHSQENASEEAFAWVRRLLEAQQDTDAEEYVRTLKVDLFADEVFVFTPQGDVTNLPANSTPIDFAYAIHSGVGNSMVAAKVNGRIVNFDYRLNSGEIVEVVTSKTARGPSRDWLQIAKSNEARTKIRQWFKREKREENVAQGRASFEAEMKHLGIPMSAMAGEEILQIVLKKVRFGALEEMYAAIGYGGASAQKCANRVKEELVHQNRVHAEKLAEQKTLEELAKPVQVEAGVAKSGSKKRSVSGIIVEDMTDCMVKFAKCCTPVPGDKIIGFITRGYGVSVHRDDCPNSISARRKPEEKDRWIKVSWDEGSQNTYKTALELTAKDRDGLTLDVATILATSKIRLISISAHSLPDGYAKISIVLEVKNNPEVVTVVNKLSQVQGVYQVTRVSG